MRGGLCLKRFRPFAGDHISVKAGLFMPGMAASNALRLAILANETDVSPRFLP